MQKASPQSIPISPAVIAFHMRNRHGETEKSNINLPGIIPSKQRIRRKPPKFFKKNKGGAPRGNRNAVTTGLHTKKARTLRDAARKTVAELKLAAALVKAERVRLDTDSFLRLRRAGLSRRSLWLSEP